MCVLHILSIKCVFLSYKLADGKRRKGEFSLEESLSTHKAKERATVSTQWALVFQHSTCPIIYTPLTGAILKSVIGGKLFVSKRLAQSESTSARVRGD